MGSKFTAQCGRQRGYGNRAGVATRRERTRHAQDLPETLAPQDETRLLALEAWVKLKFSLPHDLPGVQEAVALANRALDDDQFVPRDPLLLPSLAAILGRPGLGSALLDETPITGPRTPGRLGSWGPQALMFAAFGRPADSLSRALDRLRAEIRLLPDSSQRALNESAWVARGQSLAFPASVGDPSPMQRARANQPLTDGQLALLEGDTLAAWAAIARLDRSRRGMDATDLTIDGTYPETRLFLLLGDTTRALLHVRGSLDALASAPPRLLVDPTRAAALLMSIVLRAELEAWAGDPIAAWQWASSAEILLANSEGSLQGTHSRMTELAELHRPSP